MTGSFESLLNTDFRWSTPGDRALVAAPDWFRNATVAQHPFDRMVLMTDGYKQAADILVAKAIEDRPSRDLLLYPIVFCYRHFIELSLKYVIVTYGRRAGVQPNLKDHDLDLLWPEFCRVLAQYGEGDKSALSVVEAVVAEFTKIDQGSFTFRYPTSRKGDPIVINQDNIDLAQLRDTMDGVANFFTGADGYLDDANKSIPTDGW